MVEIPLINKGMCILLNLLPL